MAPAILLAKLTYVLGIINIISIMIIFFSCRCLSGRLAEGLFRYGWFRKFYSYHCYYWRIFIISVLVHAVVAMITFGNLF